MTTSINTLIERGYGWVIVAKVEGIPHLFGEREPKRVDADASPALPSGYDGFHDALILQDDQRLSIEMDREKGVARGNAFELVLDRDVIERDGLDQTLFRRPTKRAILQSDLLSGDSQAEVDDVSGWDSSNDRLYIGRELLDFTGTTNGSPDTFDGLTHGVVGLKYKYRVADPEAFASLTNIPTIWRGRFVSLHLHAISPEGRILDDTWLSGDFHEVLWRGYIDTVPEAHKLGLSWKVLPLVRLLSQDVGSDVKARALSAFEDELTFPVPSLSFGKAAPLDSSFPIVVSPDSQVTLLVNFDDGTTSGTDGGKFPHSGSLPSSNEVWSLGQWWQRVWLDFESDFSGKSWFEEAYSFSSYNTLRVEAASGFNLAISAATPANVQATYWLRGFTSSFDVSESHVTFAYARAKFGFGAADPEAGDFPSLANKFGVSGLAGTWVPVVKTEGEGFGDLNIPTAGQGLFEPNADNAQKAFIEWDDKISGAKAGDGEIQLIHVTREVAGGGDAAPSLGVPGELALATGDRGTVGDVARRILESSGTGERGAYDVLDLGLGMGIPEEWITDGAQAWDRIGEGGVTKKNIMRDGADGPEEIIGGWFALTGHCLIQRRTFDGDYRLELRGTLPQSSTQNTTRLQNKDVELRSTQVPKLAEPPNQITVKRKTAIEEDPRPEIKVGSIGRTQQEGAREAEFVAPGATVEQTIQSAYRLLAQGGGQALIQLVVAPWKRLELGDDISVELAHPLIYNWSTGGFAPPKIPALVVGWDFSVADGKKRVTLLLPGYFQEQLKLCPTARVTGNISTSAFDCDLEGELGVSLTDLFSAGDTVLLYDPGSEDGQHAERTIDSISGQTVTMTTSLPAFVQASGSPPSHTRMTYPSLSSASTEQRSGWLYHDGGDEWR